MRCDYAIPNLSNLHLLLNLFSLCTAAGHLDACRAVLEPLKQRAAVAESLEASGRRKPGAAGRWRRLVSDVLDQRSSKGFTPLMLACRGGHALVAAYLLREGADPLQADVVNSRTALHYAASGGHVDCLRLLCGEGTLVATPHGPRRLTDVLCQDMTVQTCRYIDQRAYGGLTPLHFAVVTGKLEAVQALLQAGASIMVKTGGCKLAYACGPRRCWALGLARAGAMRGCALHDRAYAYRSAPSACLCG